MTQPFLITGLPRSRTAWWSIAASTAYSTCEHEPLKDCADQAALVAKWNGAADFTGVSDSGLVPLLGDVLEGVGPRTIIVRREPDEVLASFKRFWRTPFDEAPLRDFLYGCNARLDVWAAHSLVKTVAYDALRNVDVVEDCYRWLMPGNPAPFNRALMQMNVQVNRDHAEAHARDAATHWLFKRA